MSQFKEMKQMIQNEVQSIQNLEERVVFKQLMEGIFLSLYETNEKMYKTLEARVMDEESYDINGYPIRTGVVERACFDESHHWMTAMEPDDIHPPVRTAKEIREKIQEVGYCRLTTVFLHCDALKVQEIFQKDKTYKGILKGDSKFSIEVQLKRSERYMEKIEHLYHLFLKNGIPWQTLNAPYLFKMADAVVTDLPKDIPDEQVLTNISIDFSEDNPIIYYDMIPIWNVKQLLLDSVGFPIICEDYENYEHVISIKEYGSQHAYLVDENSGIFEIRKNENKLLITGKISKVKKWDIYRIQKDEDNKIDCYTYPIMDNLKKDGFAERYQRKSWRMVKTKGELKRFILGFGLEEYLKYQYCEISEADTVSHETYPMNFFIIDELRDFKGNKQFTLYFQACSEETWVLRDLASYIVSEVQELYPQYQCGGKLL